MVSLFPSQIKGEMTPFIGKRRPLSLVNFQCGIASHKGKNPKPQIVGSTHLSLVNFQCGIASHKGKKNPKSQNLGSTNMPIFDRVHEYNEHEQ